MHNSVARPCAICHGDTWTRLPEIGPHSMGSDWRVLDRPLRKCVCACCGLVKNAVIDAMTTAAFDDAYTLYAHPPGTGHEGARYEHYAGWIAQAVAAPPPARILDVGCGNGALLIALGRRWPEARLTGYDPAGDAVAHGLAAGLRLVRGTADDMPADLRADLVVSANVIEHTADPLAFLCTLRRVLSPDGRVVVICPDAAVPSVELLIADHGSSFTDSHLRVLAARAAFAVESLERAPAALGAFQMLVARPRVAAAIAVHDAACRPPGPPSNPPAGLETITAPIRRYLQRWSALDEQMTRRIGDRPLVCFGVGETAGLLRAYAPRAWTHVHACTADGVTAPAHFGRLPVTPIADFAPDTSVLLAVRPQDQPAVAARLRARFREVIAWYDLVGGD